MALTVGELKGVLTLDDRQFNAGLDRSQGKLSGVAGSIGRGLAGIGKVAAVGMATGLIAGGAAMFSFVGEANEARKVGNLTEAAIKSTGGAAHVTADHVGDLAEALSEKVAVDDEAIQSGANLLLTFTNVRNEVGKGNDIFDQATSMITDMTAALNNGEVTAEGMKASSIQLGKALNDPIKGVSALQKVGVSFTADQKKQIKTLVDSGNVLGAQKIILGELQREFGGAAAAAASPLDRLKVVAGNTAEALGGLLLPTVDKLATFLAGLKDNSGFVAFLGRARTVAVGFFREVGGGLTAFAAAWRYNDGEVTSSGFPGFMERLGFIARQVFEFFKAEVLPRLREFAGYVKDVVIPILATLIAERLAKLREMFGHVKQAIQDNKPELQQLGAFLVQVGKFIIEKVIPPLARISSQTIPLVGRAIGILIGYIAGMVRMWSAAISFFGRSKATVARIFNGFFGGLPLSFGTAWGQVSGGWSRFAGWVSGWPGAIGRRVASLFSGLPFSFGGAWGQVSGGWSRFAGWVSGWPAAIRSRVSGMFDGIPAAFRAALNWVIRKWNSLSFTIPGVDTHIPGVGTIGGFTLHTPDVPYLERGGRIRRRGVAVVGETEPELVDFPTGARVTPLSRADAGGEQRLVLDLRSDGSRFADFLVEVISNAVRRRGGNVQLVLGGGRTR